MRRRVLKTLFVAMLTAGLAIGLHACGDEEECQVDGENCSSSYKEANGITYGCCDGLSCSESINGYLVCQ